MHCARRTAGRQRTVIGADSAVGNERLNKYGKVIVFECVEECLGDLVVV